MSTNTTEQGKYIALGLVEEAARDFNTSVNKAVNRIQDSYPNMIFQEKHTNGFLWWKRTYYTYYRYSDGHMIAIDMYPVSTIRSLEKNKK